MATKRPPKKATKKTAKRSRAKPAAPAPLPRPGKRLRNGLPLRRARFVEEFLVDLNATQAAIRAGYKPRSAYQTGYLLLRNPLVRAAIEARLDELAMSAAEATRRLSDMARGSFDPFMRDDGTLDLTSARARASRGLIRKVKERERIIPQKDQEPIVERTIELELHDAKDAAVQVAKLRGLFDTTINLPGENGNLVIKVVRE